MNLRKKKRGLLEDLHRFVALSPCSERAVAKANIDLALSNGDLLGSGIGDLSLLFKGEGLPTGVEVASAGIWPLER
jgi:hypothetical protein